MKRLRVGTGTMHVSGMCVFIWLSCWYSCWKLDFMDIDYIPSALTCTHTHTHTHTHTQQKHLGYFKHILGCLRYISVTKECYQIGFLEIRRGAFSVPLVSNLATFLAFDHHNHATKEISRGSCVGAKKETTNLTRNADYRLSE